MKIVQQSELLQAKARTGKTKFWREQVVYDGLDYYIQSEYWQQDKSGVDGKHTFSVPYIVTPTNVGRANERNGKEQALFQMESDFKKQIDKGYDLIGHTNTTRLLRPMLANKFLKKEHTVKYPVMGQYKYNGVRCLNETEVGFWSRTPKLFIQECIEQLKFNTNGIITDGELMIPHSTNTFQESLRAVKKYRLNDEIDKDGQFCPASHKLWYYIYDCVIEGKTFIERYEVLKKLSSVFPEQVKLAETVQLNNRKEVEKFYKDALKNGYEGIIIRDGGGLYEIGQRSNNILKYKPTMDEEFEIIDVIEGEGRNRGCAIFVCKTKDGKVFNANPNGTEQVRQGYFRDRKKLIGQLVTITFHAWTDDMIPYFITEMTVRDYE